jgi:hypothetical protein
VSYNALLYYLLSAVKNLLKRKGEREKDRQKKEYIEAVGIHSTSSGMEC